ncbi:MAG: cupin domain-containing protein [Bradymonadaceae bacterium]
MSEHEKTNLFEIPNGLPRQAEFLEVLARGGSIRIERIISHGHTTPDDQWYDQPEAEWVVLLAGEAVVEWEDGAESVLGAGDWIFIAPNERHRVIATTTDPPSVWLAVHGDMSLGDQ